MLENESPQAENESQQTEPIITVARPRDVPMQAAGTGDELPPGYHWDKNGKKRKDYTRRQDKTSSRGKVKNDAGDVVGAIASEDMASLLANTTMGIHAMLAEVVDERCALSEQQAKIEGEAIARILEQYKMDPDGKYLPWIVLFGTLMLCETPTIVVLSGKVKSAQIKRNAQTGEVIEGKLIDTTSEETA